MGPRSLQDRLSPQNSRPRTLVPGRRGQRRPFTTAILSQGHARTEFCPEFSSRILPPRRPAPPVQSSPNQPLFRPCPPEDQTHITVKMFVFDSVFMDQRSPERFAVDYTYVQLHTLVPGRFIRRSLPYSAYCRLGRRDSTDIESFISTHLYAPMQGPRVGV